MLLLSIHPIKTRAVLEVTHAHLEGTNDRNHRMMQNKRVQTKKKKHQLNVKDIVQEENKTKEQNKKSPLENATIQNQGLVYHLADNNNQSRRKAIHQSTIPTVTVTATTTTKIRQLPKLPNVLSSKTCSSPFQHGRIKSALKNSETTRTNNKNKQRTNRVHVVNFRFVHIREHALTVGQHDWCDGGLPITLDWKHAIRTRSMQIDDYEWMRERQGRTPKGRLPKLSLTRRMHLLHKVSGMDKNELQATMMKLEGTKHSSSDYNNIPKNRSKTVTEYHPTK